MFAAVEAQYGLSAAGLIVRCQTEKEAFARNRAEHSYWADLAAIFGAARAYLAWPRCRGLGIPIAASSSGSKSKTFASILSPQIHSANLPLTSAVRGALDLLAENPEAKYFLSRISPDLSKQIQIAATESTQSLIIGATPGQVIGRDRKDYWFPEDLENFNRDVQQQLSVGRSMDYSYRGFSPVTRSNWRRFSGKVTCLEEFADGSTIQLVESLGAVPIEAPVPVLA